MSDSKIVAATGYSSLRMPGSSKPLAQQIQKAVVAAIEDCQKRGEQDPAVIRAAILAARAKVKKEFDDAVNLASAAATQAAKAD